MQKIANATDSAHRVPISVPSMVERMGRWIVLGAGTIMLIMQCILLQARQCAKTTDAQLSLPVPTLSQEMPWSPQVARLPDACNTFAHTEFGGGSVVGGGSRLRLPNATACCEACVAHNVAQPRPRGRVNCTTWVYNHDQSHAQAGECWLKRHSMPWADFKLIVGGSKSWTTGLALAPPPEAALGLAPTSRSCGDGRWQKAAPPISPSGAAAWAVESHVSHGAPQPIGPFYVRPSERGVHGPELSHCPSVSAAEADIALLVGDNDGNGSSSQRVRLRLNRRVSPRACAWIDSLVDSGSCAPPAHSVDTGRKTRRACAPHCCNFYRGEAAVGVHTLPDTLLRAHGLEQNRLPRWGHHFWWGPPYAFIQGRLWHGGRGPWHSNDTNLPTEGTLPVLHRGTVELVGGGPDFLIALADHPMMPPHNAFAHVVEEDMRVLDALIERGPLVAQNWGAINATVFKTAVPFSLVRVAVGADGS